MFSAEPVRILLLLILLCFLTDGREANRLDGWTLLAGVERVVLTFGPTMTGGGRSIDAGGCPDVILFGCGCCTVAAAVTGVPWPPFLCAMLSKPCDEKTNRYDGCCLHTDGWTNIGTISSDHLSAM